MHIPIIVICFRMILMRLLKVSYDALWFHYVCVMVVLCCCFCCCVRFFFNFVWVLLLSYEILWLIWLLMSFSKFRMIFLSSFDFSNYQKSKLNVQYFIRYYLWKWINFENSTFLLFLVFITFGLLLIQNSFKFLYLFKPFINQLLSNLSYEILFILIILMDFKWAI